MLGSYQVSNAEGSRVPVESKKAIRIILPFKRTNIPGEWKKKQQPFFTHIYAPVCEHVGSGQYNYVFK